MEGTDVMANERTEARYARGPDCGLFRTDDKPPTLKSGRLFFLVNHRSRTVLAGTLCTGVAAFAIETVIRAFLSRSNLNRQADPARTVSNRVRNHKKRWPWRGRTIAVTVVSESICRGDLQAMTCQRKYVYRSWIRRTSALPRMNLPGRLRRGRGVDIMDE